MNAFAIIVQTILLLQPFISQYAYSRLGGPIQESQYAYPLIDNFIVLSIVKEVLIQEIIRHSRLGTVWRKTYRRAAAYPYLCSVWLQQQNPGNLLGIRTIRKVIPPPGKRFPITPPHRDIFSALVFYVDLTKNAWFLIINSFWMTL